MKLYIYTKNDRAFIDNLDSTIYRLGTINCAFGNVVSMLTEEFPGRENHTIEYRSNCTINRIRKKLSGEFQDDCKTIWGFKENGYIMYKIFDFIDGREKISLTLKDVEKIRIENNLTTNYLPISGFDVEAKDGIYFEINSIFEVVYTILYYYAFNDLKLVKCEHCGRWFATKSLKNKYCSRSSTFDGYKHLKCEQAVKNIKQELSREKKRIYNSMVREHESTEPFIQDFLEECANYTAKIKKRASIKNLSDYWDFLKNTRRATKDACI